METYNNPDKQKLTTTKNAILALAAANALMLPTAVYRDSHNLGPLFKSGQKEVPETPEANTTAAAKIAEQIRNQEPVDVATNVTVIEQLKKGGEHGDVTRQIKRPVIQPMSGNPEDPILYRIFSVTQSEDWLPIVREVQFDPTKVSVNVGGKEGIQTESMILQAEFGTNNFISVGTGRIGGDLSPGVLNSTMASEQILAAGRNMVPAKSQATTR